MKTGNEGFAVMVSLLVRLRFAPEDREQIAEDLRQLAAESRREPGCITYIPHHVEGDPDTVVIYEQYRDEDAQAAHRKTEHFRKYAVEGLFQRMKDRSIEDLIALF